MRKILLFFIFILLLGSCQKDKMTVTLKISGTLSVKVIDGSNNPLKDQNVRLYNSYSSSDNNELDKITTNSNGDVNFGELTEGTYTVVIDTPKVNGVKYLPVKTLQVLSGTNKSVTINVQDYTGTLKVYVVDYNSVPLVGYNVILIPYETYNSSDNINTSINKSEFHSVTNSSGIATFIIPSSRDFVIKVYDNTKTNISSSNYSYVNKDEIKTLNIQMYIY